MKGLALPLALVAALALAAVLAVSLLPAAEPATQAERAAQLASELRCPDCQGLSVAESHTAAANAIRTEIAAQLAAGRSMDEVRQHFVDRFGEWILLSPRSPLPWLLPVLGLVAGAGLLVGWLRRSPRGPTAAAPQLTDAERERIRDEVEALDA